MMMPSTEFVFSDSFRERCFMHAYFRRLPGVIRRPTAKGFPAGANVTPKDEANVDGWNISEKLLAKNASYSDVLSVLQKFPPIKKEKFAMMSDRYIDGLSSSQLAFRDQCDVELQRIRVACMMTLERLPKIRLQRSSSSRGTGQTGNKDKKPSRCADSLNTCTPSCGCNTRQNCTLCKEECIALENKVQQLEQEVTQLKKQLADVLVSRQGAPGVSSNYSAHLHVSRTTQSVPHPPPPPLQFATKHNKPREPIRKTKNCEERRLENHQICMKEVLKGLKDVKLRSVDRSPGGTPFKPKGDTDSVNLPSALEAAFRKRLANFHPRETEIENDTDDLNSSWSI